MSTQIYLGKSGRAFGPYTQDEFDSMKTSGKLRDFSWTWNAKAKEWSPLDPAPPPLSLSTDTAAGGPAKSSKPVLRHDSILPLEAICHDRRSAISGQLRLASEHGCELISHHALSAPPFTEGSSILVNLLDPKSGRSMDTRARVDGIQQKAGSWHYKLSWTANCPELVMENISG
ncbi:MAG TPA: hypothetical protein VJB59_14370 [Bdellovibrionota bacterium]|nr:hypothetical protein [Bdellovibrionota bacterium]